MNRVRAYYRLLVQLVTVPYIGPPPPLLPPGTPLPGGGVAGQLLYSWSWPPRVAWEGWVATGDVWAPTDDWMYSVQLTAYYPVVPPADAGPPPRVAASTR